MSHHSTQPRTPQADLQTNVQYLPGVGPDRAKLLEKISIFRAADLLFYFPRAVQEPILLQDSQNFEHGTRTSFVGTIQEMDDRISQNGRHLLGVRMLADCGASVRLLWFNQPFRKKDLRIGQRLIATGIMKSTVLNWEMVQPQIALLGSGEMPRDQRPLPVYPLTEGITQSHLHKIMERALPQLIPLVHEVLPDSLRETLQVCDIQTALRNIHFPADMEAAQAAFRRFKLQELLVLQLAISMQRAQRERVAIAPVCEPSGKIHSRILNRLGFTLTYGQQTAIADIGRDMARPVPMNRLLQGDVGSGKTVVAQYAMLLCVAHGYQAALMAPTEVLAQQHAQTLQKSLAASRVRVALLTGSLSKTDRRELLAKAANGEVDLVVGTQALLSNELQFKNLGLVIVDEQHKFGVLQRAKLRVEGAQPHYLVLSATPIPRTIAMTAFGDLDVSTIRESPPGRAAVHTYTTTFSELESWWKFVQEKLSEGRQAFVITPRVTDSERQNTTDKSLSSSDAMGTSEHSANPSTAVANAIGVYEELSKGVFANRRVGLLHGRLSGPEKELVLEMFASHQLDLLVATTVVEVGIDVSNATLMTILDANLLGLSQLHQLRGRVSRGHHTGYVCAVASKGAEEQDNQRLAAFRISNDGFHLAELDLKMRGPGDLLGTSQSGIPPLRVANLVEDADLLDLARTVARDLLAGDPGLDAPQWQPLRKQTLHRYAASMQLSDVG